MKRILVIFTTVFYLLSCQKEVADHTDPPPPQDCFLKFKASGQVYAYNGAYSIENNGGVSAIRSRVGSGPGSFPVLRIDGLTNGENEFDVELYEDSVKSGQTYIVGEAGSPPTGLASFLVGGKVFLVFPSSIAPQETLSVTITQHGKGWISGTFTGNMGWRNISSGPFENLAITEGSFQTKVLYQ